jgi:hypothetical protein
MRLATLMFASLTWLFSQGCVASVLSDSTTRHVESCSAYEICEPAGGGRGDGLLPLALGSALLGAMSVAVVRHIVSVVAR